MAAIDYFVSVPFREAIPDDQSNSGLNSGTSSSTNDYIELRMRVQDGSSVATGLTRKDVLLALERFEMYIISGGKAYDGANLPVS